MWMIKKAVLDTDENSCHNAFHYRNVGYVETEKEAKSVCENSKTLTAKGLK